MVYNRCVVLATARITVLIKCGVLTSFSTRLDHGKLLSAPQSRRYGSQPRRNGEVYLLYSARQRSEIESEKENRRIRDGEIVTACEQACPTRAITFGILTTQEQGAQLKAQARNYSLLEELNTRPRTLPARLRNPNPRSRRGKSLNVEELDKPAIDRS